MNRNIHSQMQSQIRNIFYFWVTSKLQIEKLTPNFELHKKLSSKMTSLGERKKKSFATDSHQDKTCPSWIFKYNY